jgi:hypothetical protein
VNPIADRLLDAYRRELELYEEILALSRLGLSRARAGRPLPEGHETSVRKRKLLRRLEDLEGSVAPEKKIWRERPTEGPRARELSALLDRLTELLREILHTEREMDRWTTEAAGLTGEDGATSATEQVGDIKNQPSNAEAASTPLLPGGDR